jgi:hypothetical protein
VNSSIELFSQEQAADMQSDSQRAMVAAKLANIEGRGRPKNSSIELFSQEQAADIEHVSRRTVQRAVIVLESGDVELIEAVEQGDASSWPEAQHGFGQRQL